MSAEIAISEYEETLDQIFSLYLDVTEGFRHIAKTTSTIYHPDHEPKSRRRSDGSTSPGHVVYALGKPEDERYTELSARSPGQIIRDNLPNARNHTLMAQMSIVMAYQYWEDYFRERIATAYGIAKNELTIPLFGDLRFIRRSVIHYRGNAIADKNDFVHLKPVSRGEHLDFDRDDMNGIWFFLKQALRDLKAHGPAHFSSAAAPELRTGDSGDGGS
jgi:hypothetical protein